VSHLFVPATASTRSGESGGRFRYDTEIHSGWEIGERSNGGYLLALVGRAMADVAERPPLSVTGHYLSPGSPGPAHIEVDVVRVGRRLTTLRATLSAGDRALLTVLGTFGRPPTDGPVLNAGGPPDLPPYDLSDPAPPPSEPPLPTMFERLALRLHPDHTGFRHGRPTGEATIAGWFALADEQPIDEIGLLLAVDAFPPPIFNSGLPVAWVPTIELTVHVRAVPEPGPLRAVFRSRHIAGGLLDEDGELWDRSDTLVAQSRQLALTPRA
jgi:acyl-coenzyme A thioesterase PaaI-like protein